MTARRGRRASELDLASFLQQLAKDRFDGYIIVELNPDSLEAEDTARLYRNVADSITFCRHALGQA